MTPKRREPNNHMIRTANQLFETAEERGAFLEALTAGISKEGAIILLEDRPEARTFPRQGPTAWQPDFVIRLGDGFKVGNHPLYEKGAFYSLDFSSVFAATAMLAIPEKPERVLDLCAAPGGKAVFAWRAFHPEVLIGNEVIRKRTGSLISNFERCKVTAGMVASADPATWAKLAPEQFDLVIADAPCSGQSLIAKGDDAPGSFSPQMVDMCVGRQRRIVANAATCLRPGGHLLYATCTYAIKENEKVVAWLLEENPEMEAVEVPGYAEFRSRFSEFPSYRLFPQSGLGAGAFVCLLRKKGEPLAHREPLKDLPIFWRYGDAPKEKPLPKIKADHSEEPETPEGQKKKRPGSAPAKGKGGGSGRSSGYGRKPSTSPSNRKAGKKRR